MFTRAGLVFWISVPKPLNYLRRYYSVLETRISNIKMHLEFKRFQKPYSTHGGITAFSKRSSERFALRIWEGALEAAGFRMWAYGIIQHRIAMHERMYAPACSTYNSISAEQASLGPSSWRLHRPTDVLNSLTDNEYGITTKMGIDELVRMHATRYMRVPALS